MNLENVLYLLICYPFPILVNHLDLNFFIGINHTIQLEKDT